MASINVTGVLNFTGSIVGGAIVPSTGWNHSAFESAVFDATNDDIMNSGDYWSNPVVAYNGYTVELLGETYAVFQNGSSFNVPYDSAVADLSVFDDTAITQSFTLVGDGPAVANCFLTGTGIATPDGDRAVETLQIGDLVRTADGRDVPVKWLARQTIRPTAVNMDIPAGRLPVCISKGALGHGVPHRDLYLTADHGVVVDDYLVNAGALVNGMTIRLVPLAEMPAEFTYWHVELEDHDEILANGAATESFVDYVGRRSFDNAAEYDALYGCERIIPEMKRPRISARRQLPKALRDRFGIGDSGASGEVQDLIRRLRA